MKDLDFASVEQNPDHAAPSGEHNTRRWNDQKMPIDINDNIYETTVKPTMTRGYECWEVNTKDTQKPTHH